MSHWGYVEISIPHNQMWMHSLSRVKRGKEVFYEVGERGVGTHLSV